MRRSDGAQLLFVAAAGLAAVKSWRKGRFGRARRAVWSCVAALPPQGQAGQSSRNPSVLLRNERCCGRCLRQHVQANAYKTCKVMMCQTCCGDCLMHSHGTLCGIDTWLCAPFTALGLAWSTPYGPCPLLVVTTGVPTTGSGLNGFSSAAHRRQPSVNVSSSLSLLGTEHLCTEMT